MLYKNTKEKKKSLFIISPTCVQKENYRTEKAHACECTYTHTDHAAMGWCLLSRMVWSSECCIRWSNGGNLGWSEELLN